MYKCKHFKIQELVSKQVHKKYGESAWRFFDPRLLETIDFIREKIDRSITVNDWFWNGSLNQRGLRCNLDPIVKSKTDSNKIYLSAHTLGMAVDFNVKGLSANYIRVWMHSIRLPYPIRIEKDVNWVHLDVIDMGVNIYEFKA